MNRTVFPALALAAGLAAGCAAESSAETNLDPVPAVVDDVKPVAPAANIQGKWRHENMDGKSSRISVYHFRKDGSVDVEIRTETPDRKYSIRSRQTVVQAEKDRIAIVELSQTGEDGVEHVFPSERRRRYQTEVKGDELRLTPVDAAGKTIPDAKPLVLKRVKE
jgi:hypothetical protein